MMFNSLLTSYFTDSNLYIRVLAKALYKKGYIRVQVRKAKDIVFILNDFDHIRLHFSVTQAYNFGKITMVEMVYNSRKWFGVDNFNIENVLEALRRAGVPDNV